MCDLFIFIDFIVRFLSLCVPFTILGCNTRCNPLCGQYNWLHSAINIESSKDGTLGIGLLWWFIIKFPVHGRHRAQVHCAWRYFDSNHFRSDFRIIRLFRANRLIGLVDHLFCHSASAQHRSHSAQQQYTRRGNRQSGRHRNIGHYDWTICIACALRHPPIHTVHRICGADTEVFGVVCVAIGHIAASV